MMNPIERLVSFFNRRAALRLGAVQQPSDLMDYVYAVHARAYQRITGKALSRMSLSLTRTRKIGTQNLGGRSLFGRVGRRT